MTCQNCGNQHSAKYCPECGAPAAQVAACPQCGLSSTSKYCPECGTPMGNLPAPAQAPLAEMEPAEPLNYYQHPPQYSQPENTMVYNQPLPQTAQPQQPAAQPAYPPPAPAQQPGPTLQVASAQSTPTIIINNNNENYNTAVGSPQNPYPPAYPGVNIPASRKSKVIALILSILFGYWGIHYFYVGRIGMGLLYLFSFGFFGIGWLVDIARIAMGSFKDSWGYPLLI